jgi:hypothetical protein
MSRVDFIEYLSCLDEDHPHFQVLESSYAEAARVMSPNGLSNYLEGVRAMCTLGRGEDLILSYIESTPRVVKEVGEDIIPDIVHSIMAIASHTSGSVIALMLANLPLAAQRFGDADLVHNYLSLLHQLTGKAPRGLRPMMENLTELLSKLTLGGLRRWAMWGAQAHARDLDGQMAYFALQSDSARAVLQKERRGTLFIDNQRKLNFYLRALWGRSFFMKPTAGDYENRRGIRPYIQDWFVHVPDAFDDHGDLAGIDIYRATVAHAAAHMVYTDAAISAEQLSPLQMKCIDLFEDARIEHLAILEFPGLEKLWKPFFENPLLEEGQTLKNIHPALALMFRAGRAMIDHNYSDDEDRLANLVKGFRQALEADPRDNQHSWNFGMEFFHLMKELAGLPSLRIAEELPVPYRDDNRFCWEFSEIDLDRRDSEYIPASQGQIRRKVGLMEFVNAVDVETAGDDSQEIWTLDGELFPYEDLGISYNQMEGKEPVSDPYHYDEWDYQVQLHRPDWTTVYERRQGRGDPELMDEILIKHRPIAQRIRHLVDAMQPQGIVRKRGYEEGEEIDINAAVKAMSDIRRGVMPDPRINIRITRHVRDLAVVVLLDLSESTNEKIDKDDAESATILSLTREATGLMAWAIDSIGDPFAVHGFASDGRHDVQYYRFKDFDQSYNDEAKSRLAGATGGLSTRMGAALRHAGHHLSEQSAQKRLILLVTDGEPADIDERDPQYLRHDTKKAVEDLASKGVFTYCLTLDPTADRYVARIFGENRYSIVDHVEKLPERLPAVFAMLTG